VPALFYIFQKSITVSSIRQWWERSGIIHRCNFWQGIIISGENHRCSSQCKQREHCKQYFPHFLLPNLNSVYVSQMFLRTANLRQTQAFRNAMKMNNKHF
jgi:hypothetical protein